MTYQELVYSAVDEVLKNKELSPGLIPINLSDFVKLVLEVCVKNDIPVPSTRTISNRLTRLNFKNKRGPQNKGSIFFFNKCITERFIRKPKQNI